MIYDQLIKILAEETKATKSINRTVYLSREDFFDLQDELNELTSSINIINLSTPFGILTIKQGYT